MPSEAAVVGLNKSITTKFTFDPQDVEITDETVTAAEVEKAFAETYLSVDALQDYTINSVQWCDPNDWANDWTSPLDPNIWIVDYSVLPKDGHNEWIAGNGWYGENGWIVHKMLFVYVVKTNGVVGLRILGTGL